MRTGLYKPLQVAITLACLLVWFDVFSSAAVPEGKTGAAAARPPLLIARARRSFRRRTPLGIKVKRPLQRTSRAAGPASKRPSAATKRGKVGGGASSPAPAPARPRTSGAKERPGVKSTAGRGAGPVTESGENAKRVVSQAPDDEMVQLDFKNADIRVILEFLSEKTRTNYLYDESVKGTLSILGPKSVPLKEAVWILESMLEYKGYTVVDMGAFKKVVPKKRAQGEVIETRVSEEEREAGREEPLPPVARDRLVTELIRIRHVPVQEIQNAVRAFLSNPNAVVSYPPTNTVIVTESALNIERVKRIIAELDTPIRGKQVHVVPLEYSKADVVAKQLAEILKAKAQEKTEPPTTQKKVAEPVVMADRKTNSLVVICMDYDFPQIRGLIRELDRDVRWMPIIRKVRLRYAEAEEVAKQVKELFSVGDAAKGFKIIADPRENTVVVSSYLPRLVKRIVGYVEGCDVPVVDQDEIVVEVYHMEFAEAAKVAELLNSLEFSVFEEATIASEDAGGSRGGVESAGKVAGGRRSSRRKKDEEEPKISIIADEATNSLVITAPRKTLDGIKKVVRQLDKVRPQVLVEVLIVEIDVSRAKALGLDFNAIDTESDHNRPFAIGNTDQLENLFANGGISTGLHVGILTGSVFDVSKAAEGDVGELSKIGVLISTFRNDTGANILSAPQLVTSDNETAKILVGEQIQLPSSFSTAANTGLNTITNFTTEDVGITLEITPRITHNDHVVLKLQQEIKSRTKDTLYSFAVPVISKREIDTSITVADGETIVIGGLISESENEVKSEIPVLGRLPLMGRLFRSRRTEKKKTNLLVFLTPHIIRNSGDYSMITRRKAENVADLVGHSSLMKRLSATIPVGSNQSTPRTTTTSAVPRFEERLDTLSPCQRERFLELRSRMLSRLRGGAPAGSGAGGG